jgi:hypothetical protein
MRIVRVQYPERLRTLAVVVAGLIAALGILELLTMLFRQ